MSIEVTVAVKTYDETKPEKIYIHSHWNDRDMVKIKIGGKEVVVLGEDLKSAIDNCMNVE